MEQLKISNATHFIYIADIHFGKYQNTEEWQEIQRDYFTKWFIPTVKNYFAGKPNAKPVFMVLGDVYDDRKSIDINVENLAIDIFEELSQVYPVYIINGNHDLSKKTNQGNTSLRSLNLLETVTLISEPTMITVKNGAKKMCTVAAIPYLGNYDNETNALIESSGVADIALMHTEIMNLKMDNGMLITSGNNPDMFKGHIYSGHIHRRQEHKNVTYVGSPYHLTKSDIGDQKGVYIYDFANKCDEFIPNDFSPKIQVVDIHTLLGFSETERRNYLDNNFTSVIIDEEELPTIKKKVDVYDLANGTTAREVKPVIKKVKQSIDVDNAGEYKELPISELIKQTISLMDLDDDTKTRLGKLSDKYIKDAEEKMNQV